jgi:Family of unknown function (DUF5677)
MMNFNFGATAESGAFFARNPTFYPAFERLVTLGNKTFSREQKYENRTEEIGFNLGQTCRMDFLEVVFLAAHGFGIGASKLVRGLYERAVALAYMIKHPEKSERFIRYGAIQEFKAMVAALELISEEVFDEAMAPKTTVAQIRANREMVKPEFQVEVCRECHRKDTAFSWDEKGVLAQVQDVGFPYDKLYLGAYTIPNIYVHASLASAFQESDAHHHEAEFALISATAVFLLVIRSQNTLFSLGL